MVGVRIKMSINRNNKLPLISVGVLNCNGLKFLKKIIPKITDLNYPNKEIIVVDNGSSDGSITFLNSIKGIKIITNKTNIGYGAGKNKIVENSNGEYILLIDNDIELINKDLLSKLLLYYNSKDNISFLSIPLLDIGKQGTIHYGLFYSNIKKEVSIRDLLLKREFLAGGFIGGLVFFRRKIFLRLGMYDTTYPFCLDDYDLSARAYNKGYNVYIFCEYYANHLGVGNRQNLDNLSWKNQYFFCGFGRMVVKNYNLTNSLIWLPTALVWFLFKSLGITMKFKSLKPLRSYFTSLCYFINDFADSIKARKIIQSNRVLKEDIFLSINPPKFD